MTFRLLRPRFDGFGFARLQTAQVPQSAFVVRVRRSDPKFALGQVVGHTDTVGSARYNQKLSECRANAAATNLEGKGVPDGAIHTSGKGKTDLLIQTGDGVKEPQNRRDHRDKPRPKWRVG